MQSGGAQFFQKKAAVLEKQVTSAEREAGGNQQELELNLKRVRVCWEGVACVCRLRLCACVCVHSLCRTGPGPSLWGRSTVQ